MIISKNSSNGEVAPRQVTLTAERSIFRLERKERREIKGKKRKIKAPPSCLIAFSNLVVYGTSKPTLRRTALKRMRDCD